MTNHRIEVTLTEEDIIAVNCFMQFRLKIIQESIRRQQWIGGIVFVSFIVLIQWFAMAVLKTNYLELNGMTLLIITTLFVVLVLFHTVKDFPKYMHKKMCKNLQKILRELQGDLFDKPHVIELRDEEIYSQNFRGQAMYPYSSLGEITEDNGRVYVFIGKDRALILPRDRIPAATLDAFLDELKRKVAGASCSHDGKEKTP